MRPTRSVAAAALAAALLAAAAPAADLKIGATAPDFTLPSASDGKPVALKELLSKNKGVAVLFIATKCPVSNAYNERMAALGKEYAAKGIAFVGINSNKAEPAAETAEHAKRNGFSFLVVKDEGNKVADAYGAQKTPEVFLLDGTGRLIYHGRIDENQDDAKAVRSPDFRNALDAFLAGKPVPVVETKAFGCTIKRV
ncbi:MAG TPA: thioredoxin family protein [Thermoanaerobaculia bacterium]|nr:thioredoxin family protein [Thermoanaerobaculia bacterium]HQR67318.1 thioredoxin family protein [Thermoanaerobaculia bacterium]